MSVPSSQKPHARRGAIVVLVLVGLLVASMLGLALVQTVLIHHRQMQAVGCQQQCFWLAEAGVGRAQRRLAAEPDYRGETWTVSAEDLAAAQPAVVTIEVVKKAGASEASGIRVEARFLDEGIRRAVCRREVALSQE